MVIASLISATNTLFAVGITTGALTNIFGKVSGGFGSVKNSFFK